MEAIRAALPQDVGLHHLSLEAVFHQLSPCNGNDPPMAQQQLQRKLQDLWMVSPRNRLEACCSAPPWTMSMHSHAMQSDTPCIIKQ